MNINGKNKLKVSVKENGSLNAIFYDIEVSSVLIINKRVTITNRSSQYVDKEYIL